MKIPNASLFASTFLAIALAACGPSDGSKTDPGNGSGADGGGDGTADADLSDLSTITGRVWAPGNAPGMVPVGQEIPVSNAVVYVTATRPDPIEQQASCVPCTQAPVNAVTTNADGTFNLFFVPPGTRFLVIEKGQFRLEYQITVEADSVVELTAEQTTLPSVHDPDNGKWTPRIAVAGGLWDHLEGILGKMGMGEVDAEGAFVPQSAAGFFDVYSNGSGNIDNQAIGTLTDLVSDLNKLMQYHIVFIPCSSTANRAALNNQQVLKNLRDYVAAGGKLYVTDWSAEWLDAVFPTQIEFGASYDTPSNAYDPVNDSWSTNLFGSGDGFPSYNSPDAEAAEMGLRDWFDGQVAPVAESNAVEPINPTAFEVVAAFNHIEGLHSVQIGTDDEGNAVIDEPVSYVIGSDGAAGGKIPMTVTFEPAGCGRVLYSSYHTTEDVHQGLVPQERALLYLIMEIGVCKSGPIID